MAVFALTAEYVALGGTDRSEYIDSATLTLDMDELDSTDFASGGWREFTGGLKKGQLAVQFNDDVAASAIDSVLWTAFTASTPTLTFEVRATNAAVGASNPKYTGTVLVSKWSLGGSIGSLAEKSLTFPVTGAVARATA